MFPYGLSHVCAQWRAAALEYPKLWSFIDVEQHASAAAQAGTVALIGAYIARSGSFPLRVVLTYDGSTRHTALGALLPAAHRWETICIDVNALLRATPSSTGLSAAEWADIAFPALRNVALVDSHYAAAGRPVRDGVALIQRLPEQKLLHYFDFCARNDYSAGSMAYPDLWNTVKMRDSFDEELPDEGLCMPALQIASIELRPGIWNADGLLGRLYFDALRALNLKISVAPFAQDRLFINGLPDYISGLTVLRLCGNISIGNPSLRNMLDALTQLVDFTIDMSLAFPAGVDIMYFIELLTPQLQPPPAPTPTRLPSLTALRVKLINGVPAFDLPEMLRQRFLGLGGVAALQSFVLFATTPTPLGTLPNALGAMVAAYGWDIRCEIRPTPIELWEARLGGEFEFDV